MHTPRLQDWWPMVRHSASLIRGLFQLQRDCLYIQLHGYSGGYCLESSACVVPEFGAREDGYEPVYALGEQWLLYTEWGPEKWGLLFMTMGQESASTPAEKRSGLKMGTTWLLLLSSHTGKNAKCSSLTVVSQSCVTFLHGRRKTTRKK